MDIRADYEAERDVVHTINCKYRPMSYMRPHFHQSIEITYLIDGKMDFCIGAEHFPLEAGQLTFVPSYFAHYGCSLPNPDNPAQAAVLIVPKHFYEEFESMTGNASYFYLPDKEKNKPIAARLLELADGIDGMNDFLVKAYTDMIFGLIAQNYEPVTLKHTHNNLMLEIIEYIDEHYDEPLTLDTLSSHFGYSKFYFSKLFNRTFNCNINSYINSVRARAVSKYSGDGKKTDIIIESGFNTPSSYYRSKK